MKTSIPSFCHQVLDAIFTSNFIITIMTINHVIIQYICFDGIYQSSVFTYLSGSPENKHNKKLTIYRKQGNCAWFKTTLNPIWFSFQFHSLLCLGLSYFGYRNYPLGKKNWSGNKELALQSFPLYSLQRDSYYQTYLANQLFARQELLADLLCCKSKQPHSSIS